MILAGNHGAATEAAVRYVTSSSGIAAIAADLGDSDFTAIIRVVISSNVPEEAELVECWKYKDEVRAHWPQI